jgi:hypothetical protein
MQTIKARATPTKDFFVRMITRDIALEDCILDLLDNAIDGARKNLHSQSDWSPPELKGYSAEIELSKARFLISDNCGGITLKEAKEYAFHFGRRADAPAQNETSIGLYGIGMKRALFKLGNIINIDSESAEDAFRLTINVGDWLSRPEDWDFDLIPLEPSGNPGTRIEVTDLHPEISAEFNDALFASKLRKIVARDYFILLGSGFVVRLNRKPVNPYAFQVKDGGEFQPLHERYQDPTGVAVEIIAGMAAPPPDEASPEAVALAPVDYYGWFVACNDRIVLAGDKSAATVWGDDSFQTWHPQYNGFLGIVNFRSRDPRLLPWTTTKREVDIRDATYRRAVARMKTATRSYIGYTNSRKIDLEAAKTLEQTAAPRPIFEPRLNDTLRLPKASSKPRVETANVNYSVEKQRIRAAAEALGDPDMTYRAVGVKTFEYFMDNEVGKD